MTRSEVITIFLQDIGEPYASGERLEFLTLAFDGAVAAIRQAGIKISEGGMEGIGVLDANLIRAYAAWMIRGRNKQEPMPPQLRRMLHDRLLSQKMKEAGDEI